ncbi:DUF3888 domain-containing protein [Priestia taiwanensis]|uniref:DUF3888 domain-containing protein n=1 Tax=Priestia taiwanensis TaxID=1347902 RepID=A0A917ALC0_9BACI|nr:DUF3888 domain-containing protein [Priestia taiwanensis]MBM7362020.1 hypothetical protein [Priestia taiwanensis]GGE58802.1 hypothetical protein GCM10007140_06450 [Priestia taiwanensis]
MKKLFLICFLFCFVWSPAYASEKQPTYELLHDTSLTTLHPSITEQVVNHYGYLKLYDATIITHIKRQHEGGFNFDVAVVLHTFEHAHNPPYGKETIVFNVRPFGVKALYFKHEGDATEKESKAISRRNNRGH